MPDIASKKIDVLLELSMHKTKSSEMLSFLGSFGEKSEDIKELRKEIAKKIPYEEKLSTMVSELRKDRLSNKKF